MASNTKCSNFTAEEKYRINKELEEYKKKSRQAEIDAYIRNKVLDEERKQPGKAGY